MKKNSAQSVFEKHPIISLLIGTIILVVLFIGGLFLGYNILSHREFYIFGIIYFVILSGSFSALYICKTRNIWNDKSKESKNTIGKGSKKKKNNDEILKELKINKICYGGLSVVVWICYFLVAFIKVDSYMILNIITYFDLFWVIIINLLIKRNSTKHQIKK